MGATARAVAPLRHGTVEGLRIRKLEPMTQEAYIRVVRKLTVLLTCPQTGAGRWLAAHSSRCRITQNTCSRSP